MKREIVSKRRQYVKENIMRMTIKEIAEVWGVGHSAIEKDLIFLRSNEGLKSKSELKQQRIQELLKKECKVKEIVEDIKITERSVYYRMKKMEPVNSGSSLNLLKLTHISSLTTNINVSNLILISHFNKKKMTARVIKTILYEPAQHTNVLWLNHIYIISYYIFTVKFIPVFDKQKEINIW